MDENTRQFLMECAHLRSEIYRTGYYVNLYERCMRRAGLELKTLEQTTKEEALNALNMFWFALPDSPEIRRYPFFLLCDLAEQLFED